MPIESFASHWHLNLVEGVLHHEIRVQLIDLLHDCIHVSSRGIREQQELRPCQSLETCQSKFVGLEVIQTSGWHPWVWIGVRGSGGGVLGGGSGRGRRLRGNFRCDRFGDGMDTIFLVRGWSERWLVGQLTRERCRLRRGSRLWRVCAGPPGTRAGKSSLQLC